MANNLAAQEQRTGRQRVVGEQLRPAPRVVGDEAAQLTVRVVVAALRAGQREIDGVGIRLSGDDSRNAVEHRGVSRFRFGRSHRQRRRWGRRQTRAHEVARLWARFDLATRFELRIGGEYRIDAQAAAARRLAHRGQAGTSRQAAVADRSAQLVSQGLIERGRTTLRWRGFSGHRLHAGLRVQIRIIKTVPSIIN